MPPHDAADCATGMIPTRRVQRAFGVHPQWVEVLRNVRIVMVETTHPGNIGSVSRVMKNMGLTKLILVSSTCCGPDSDAFVMASGAYDIVRNAQRVDTLAEAVTDCLAVAGTSARLGRKRAQARTPRELMPELLERAGHGPVACVFGRESKGLSNEEMKLCTHQMVIPTDAAFASMNVAHACAIVAYELFQIVSRPMGFKLKKFHPAVVHEREAMYRHIEEVLTRAGFLDPKNPLVMMRDIRRIFNSAQLDDRDVKIIRGIFRKMGNMVRIAEDRVSALEEELNRLR